MINNFWRSHQTFIVPFCRQFSISSSNFQLENIITWMSCFFHFGKCALRFLHNLFQIQCCLPSLRKQFCIAHCFLFNVDATWVIHVFLNLQWHIFYLRQRELALMIKYRNVCMLVKNVFDSCDMIQSLSLLELAGRFKHNAI